MANLGTGVTPIATLTAPVLSTGDKSPTDVRKEGDAALNALSTPPSPVAKAFDLTPAMKAVVLDLEGKLADSGRQDAFIKACTDQMSRIAGLKEVVAFQNQCFQMEFSRLSEPDVRERWRLLKEKGITEVGEEKAGAHAIQDIFSKRMKALMTAIDTAIVEKAILTEVITGHVKAWSISALSRATTCYGATYRLGETKAALEDRKGKLGIKPGESAPNVELPKSPEKDSTGEKLLDLSKEIACLDEGASAIYEALRTVFNEANRTEWPSKLYLQLYSEFAKNHAAIEALKPVLENRNQKIAEAIKTLEAAIKAPPDKEGDNAAFEAERATKTIELTALNQEKAEIATRWTSIKAHQDHLVTVLGHLKKLFSLEDPVVDEQAQMEEDEIADLSDVYSKAFTLLKLVTSHREKVVPENTWEHLGENNQRKAVYFNEVKKFEDLEAQKKTTVEVVAVRVASLDKEIRDHRGFIQVLDLGMNKIAEHARLLGAEAQVREKWKVEATV